MRTTPYVLLALTLAAPAAAQEATTRLQDATVVAKGNTISISRLPISTPGGTIYRDVTIELHVDAQGRVTLATDGAGRVIAASQPRAAGGAAPREVALQATPSGQAAAVELPQQPSAPIVYQKFVPGTYSAPDGSLVQIEDRGMDLVHHVPAWSLSANGSGALTAATWYSGPPFLNPRSHRLKDAQITSTEFAYGTSDGGDSEVFGSSTLIGVKQIGKKLQIVSFKHGCCSDTDTPVASLVYTYVGN
jgi:hypothetical protein